MSEPGLPPAPDRSGTPPEAAVPPDTARHAKKRSSSSTRTGLAFAVTSFGSVAAVSAVSAFVLSRLYGVETIGEFALVSAPYAFLYLISSVNERAGLIRKLSVTPRHSPRVAPMFWNVFAFSVGLTAVLGLAVAAWSVVYLRHIGHPALVLPMLTCLAAYVIVENSSWNLDSLLSAYRDGRALLVARLGQTVVILAVSLLLNSVTSSVWGLVGGLLAGFLYGFASRLLMVLARGTLRTTWPAVKAEFPELRGFITFGIRLTPSNFVSVVSLQAPVWILGGQVGVAEVGAWSRAIGQAQYLQGLSFRVNEIMLPTLSARLHDPRSFGRALDKSVRGLVPLMVMLVTVGAGSAAGIMALYGPGFEQGARALQLLLVVFGLLGAASALGSALIASGLPSAVNTASAARAVLTLLLLWPLIAWQGITGAAWAMLIGAVGPIAVQVFVLHRKGFLAGFERAGLARLFWAVAGAGAAGFLVSWLGQTWLPGLLGVTVGLSAGCLAYGVVLALLGGLRILDDDLLDSRVSSRLEQLVPRLAGRRTMPPGTL
jgi:O-antigen/teichoic acid export membrane protein